MSDPEQVMRDLGQRVQTLREYAGMTQRELGDAANLTRSSIANLEAGRQGNTPATTLVVIAKKLGVTLGALFGEVDMPALPQVEVITLHRIHCSLCGRLDDNLTDADKADSIRRDHLKSHRDGALP